MSPSTADRTIAERLREAREFLNLAPEIAADAVGLSVDELSRIESGERRVTPEDLERFARFYRLSVAFLRTGRDDAGVGAAAEQALLRAEGDLSDRERANVQRFALFLQNFRRQ